MRFRTKPPNAFKECHIKAIVEKSGLNTAQKNMLAEKLLECGTELRMFKKELHIRLNKQKTSTRDSSLREFLGGMNHAQLDGVENALMEFSKEEKERTNSLERKMRAGVCIAGVAIGLIMTLLPTYAGLAVAVGYGVVSAVIFSKVSSRSRDAAKAICTYLSCSIGLVMMYKNVFEETLRALNANIRKFGNVKPEYGNKETDVN